LPRSVAALAAAVAIVRLYGGLWRRPRVMIAAGQFKRARIVSYEICEKFKDSITRA